MLTTPEQRDTSVYFLNLTNGLAQLSALPHWGAILGQEPHFLRIQSTACEQKRWVPILNSASDDLLFYLARGRRCLVIDGAVARHETTRAIWQGLSWIRYVTSVAWFAEEPVFIHPRARKCVPYFRVVSHGLDDTVWNRMNYFAKFIPATSDHVVHLSGMVVPSDLVQDGDYEYYRTLVQEHGL